MDFNQENFDRLLELKAQLEAEKTDLTKKVSELTEQLTETQQQLEEATGNLKNQEIDKVAVENGVTDKELFRQIAAAYDSIDEAALAEIREKHPVLFQEMKRESTPGDVPGGESKQYTKADLVKDPALATKLYETDRDLYKKIMRGAA